MSVADEIKKLNDLKEQGILSEEEFQTQKAKVLGGDNAQDKPPSEELLPAFCVEFPGEGFLGNGSSTWACASDPKLVPDFDRAAIERCGVDMSQMRDGRSVLFWDRPTGGVCVAAVLFRPERVVYARGTLGGKHVIDCADLAEVFLNKEMKVTLKPKQGRAMILDVNPPGKVTFHMQRIAVSLLEREMAVPTELSGASAELSGASAELSGAVTPQAASINQAVLLRGCLGWGCATWAGVFVLMISFSGLGLGTRERESINNVIFFGGVIVSFLTAVIVWRNATKKEPGN